MNDPKPDKPNQEQTETRGGCCWLRIPSNSDMLADDEARVLLGFPPNSCPTPSQVFYIFIFMYILIHTIRLCGRRCINLLIYL